MRMVLGSGRDGRRTMRSAGPFARRHESTGAGRQLYHPSTRPMRDRHPYPLSAGGDGADTLQRRLRQRRDRRRADGRRYHLRSSRHTTPSMAGAGDGLARRLLGLRNSDRRRRRRLLFGNGNDDTIQAVPARVTETAWRPRPMTSSTAATATTGIVRLERGTTTLHGGAGSEHPGGRHRRRCLSVQGPATRAATPSPIFEPRSPLRIGDYQEADACHRDGNGGDTVIRLSAAGDVVRHRRAASRCPGQRA